MKLYRHYKQKFYKYLGEARHSENEELHIIYDCLYPNPSGQTWIRPKAMFHEEIEHQGRRQSRFEKVELKIISFDGQKMTSQLENQLLTLMKEAFGPAGEESFRSRLKAHPTLHGDFAYTDDNLVGFKLGYATDQHTFYSWLGAVSKEFQGLGIGQELMDAQHAWCREQGFTSIETKTQNQFRAMLILNLRNGFEIHGTHTSSGGLKILLQRKL